MSMHIDYLMRALREHEVFVSLPEGSVLEPIIENIIEKVTSLAMLHVISGERPGVVGVIFVYLKKRFNVFHNTSLKNIYQLILSSEKQAGGMKILLVASDLSSKFLYQKYNFDKIRRNL